LTTSVSMNTSREELEDREQVSLTEKVVHIRRVSKVVKGGRHFGFNALVVVGDGQGRVGAGLGKGEEVPDAIRKGGAVARKNLIQVGMKGTTIPQAVVAKFGAANVILKPASPGTGIIAGGGVRAVVELAGVKDILTKSLGSPNPINVVYATVKAMGMLKDPEKELAKRKGPSSTLKSAVEARS